MHTPIASHAEELARFYVVEEKDLARIVQRSDLFVCNFGRKNLFCSLTLEGGRSDHSVVSRRDARLCRGYKGGCCKERRGETTTQAAPPSAALALL